MSQVAVPTTPPADTSPPSEPYSTFAPWQKRWILLLAAAAGCFSSISGFIYFPALPFLAEDMHITIEQANLSLTVYLVVAGIAPTFTGTAADVFGRRPVLVTALTVYLGANIGLALQTSYAALLLLRMLQSAAISGTFSVAYGVLGDLVTSAERGGYSGFMAFFLNTPSSIGPLLSGLMLLHWTWRAIFWFLAAFVACWLVVTALFLPETARVIVGNGARQASRARQAPVCLLAPVHAEKVPQIGKGDEGFHLGARSRPRCLSPMSSLALVKLPGTAIILLSYGVNYTVYSCLQASLSTLFVSTYHLSGLAAGLIYLPFGVSCAVAAVVTGKILDWDYRRTAEESDMSSDSEKADDMQDLPIENARLRTVMLCVGSSGCLVILYGWLLDQRVHIAGPLVAQCFIGLTIQSLHTALNTLLVDVRPDKPSTAQASCNLVRCEMAAAFLAALDALLRPMGTGWCFTMLGGLLLALLPLLWCLRRNGLAWRQRGL